MTAIVSRRRRRTLLAFICGLVGAVMLPAGLVLAANSLLHSTDGDSVDTKNIITIPSTPAALLAVVDVNGSITSLQMIALAPGGVGGTIVSIPVGASAKVAAGEAPRRLGDAYLSAGFAGLVTETEGLLNISFSSTLVVNEADLVAMFAGENQVSVIFSRAVTTLDTGGVRELFSAGEHKLDATGIAAVLAANQAGAPESERLSILKSLWVGIAGVGRNAIARSTTLPDASLPTSSTVNQTGSTVATPPNVNSFLAQVLTGEVQVWQFAAVAIAQGDENPTGADMYKLDNAEIIMVVASVAPSSVSSLLVAINVQIDSSFTDATITREAVLRLAYLGVNIVLVRELPGEVLQETIVEYSDELVASEVAGYSSVFGPLASKFSQRQVEGIDARIVLGNDFKEFIAGQPSSGGLTTTTTTVLDETGLDF